MIGEEEIGKAWGLVWELLLKPEVEKKLHQAYRDILQRDADRDGYDFYLAMIRDCQMTLADVRKEMVESPEAKLMVESYQQRAEKPVVEPVKPEPVKPEPVKPVDNGAHWMAYGHATVPISLQGPMIGDLVGEEKSWARRAQEQGFNCVTLNPMGEWLVCGEVICQEVLAPVPDPVTIEAVEKFALELKARGMMLDLLFFGDESTRTHPKACGWTIEEERGIIKTAVQILERTGCAVIYRYAWDAGELADVHARVESFAKTVKENGGRYAGCRGNRVENGQFPPQFAETLTIAEWEMIRPRRDDLLRLRRQVKNKPVGSTDIYRQSKLYEKGGFGVDRNITLEEQIAIAYASVFAGGVMGIYSLLPDEAPADGRWEDAQGSLVWPTEAQRAMRQLRDFVGAMWSEKMHVDELGRLTDGENVYWYHDNQIGWEAVKK